MLRVRLIPVVLGVFGVLGGCATLFVDTEGLSGGRAADEGGANNEAAADVLDPAADGGEVEASTLPEASTYRETVLLDGPVLYYRLAEPSGVQALNEVTGGVNGEYVNTIVRAAPSLIHADDNAAARFENTGVVKVDPGAIEVAGSAPISIEMWIRATGQTADYRYPFTKETTVAGRRGVAILLKDDAIAIERYAAGAGKFATKTGLVIDAVTHVVGTYDGSFLRLYVNAELIQTVPDERVILAAVTDPIQIGSANGTGSVNSVLATIDEVAVYNKALSEERVKVHYEFGRPR